MMADIFSSATVVVVWLDESQNQLNELTTVVSGHFSWEYESLCPYQDSPLRNAIFDLSAHDYWSRLWVVQEFCLAKDIIIMLGADSCAVDQLQYSFSKYPKYFRTRFHYCKCDNLFAPRTKVGNRHKFPSSSSSNP